MDQGSIFKVILHVAVGLLLCSAFGEAQDTSFSLAPGNMTCENSLLQCFEDGETVYDVNSNMSQVSLTNRSTSGGTGYVFYRKPVRLMDPSSNTAASFSTRFTFRIIATNITTADGLVFVMLANGSYRGYGGRTFGVYKVGNDGNPTANSFQGTKTLCVEFDTYQNPEDAGYSDNHVGVDITSIESVAARNASDVGITLSDGKPVTAWIDYDFTSKNLEVRISLVSNRRPKVPLVAYYVDLTTVLNETMTIGFAASTGSFFEFHYLLDWSLETYGLPLPITLPPPSLPPPLPPPAFSPSLSPAPFRPQHPQPPFSSRKEDKGDKGLIAGVSIGAVSLLLLLCCLGFTYRFLKTKRDPQNSLRRSSDNRLVELSVDMPFRFTYKQLSVATNGFSEASKLGQGGSSSVYRGVIASTGIPVAVKRVANNYKHGEKDFLAEISVVSKLRHRHLVKLLGWCADRGNFLLVYELMPNGSLDKLLFEPGSEAEVLTWKQRLFIVRGVAAGLAYLHEGFSQQVIHRDIKSSNIMLDFEFNALVGDFGLARLMEHSKRNEKTQLAGTIGYIAPEAAVSGEFSSKTDVYAFGALVLEIACGRPAIPIGMQGKTLLDWAWSFYSESRLLEVADAQLGGHFPEKEMEQILLVGLLCSHPDPNCRPSMREVELILSGHIAMPTVPLVKPVLVFSSSNLSWKEMMNSIYSNSSLSSFTASSTNTGHSSSSNFSGP